MTPRVDWGAGAVGDAVRASFARRVMRFIRDEESEPIQLFSDEMRAHSRSGEWYGEHAGKWLVTAGHAWRRTESAELAECVRRVVAYLSAHQETNGYLGTYAEEYEGRMTHPLATEVRTWDPWVHAWLILGLLQVADVPGVEDAEAMALRIGDLLVATFNDERRSLLDIGNHRGLSSAVVLQPLAELTLRTGEPKYAELAETILVQMEEQGLPLLSGPDTEADISDIGTGKAYQLCWILVGLTTLHRANENVRLLRAAEYWWKNISVHHLTPMGGPWGGVGTHKEVFNDRGFFSPYGLTETCATASWMALSRELFLITGRDRYADAFETSLWNALLGAMDENGEEWCYFTFPNGRRNNTYHWACCKSSGAMALEEAASMAVIQNDEGISLNLWHSLEASTTIGEKDVRIHLIVEETGRDGEIRVDVEEELEFALTLRIPAGSRPQSIAINGEDVGEFYPTIHRRWQKGDCVQIRLAFDLKIHPFTYSLDHHGQEIVRTDYAHLRWGPLVYATALIDGYKKEETLRLARLTPEAPFTMTPGDRGEGFPTIDLVQPGRNPISFRPYFEAGGRHDGAWRSTWMQVAWQ